HTFVGHFIGSPGMNILPCNVEGDRAVFEGHALELEGPVTGQGGDMRVGIRPEYIGLGETGVPAQLVKVADVGRHFVLDAMVGETLVKAVTENPPPPTGTAINLAFQPDQTRVYRDGWIATEKRA
ncbi:MAG: TOBE domain-containing protein, partial [Pseudomonadota bacterium]